MATTDYDYLSNMAIGPWGIHETATALHDYAQNVADSVSRIATTLQSLTLNDWVGKTQQEADDFNKRWRTVMGDIFGSDEKPDDGVLSAIATGLATALHNYNAAEFGLTDVWNRFTAKFDAPPQPWRSAVPPLDIDTTPPPDVLDTNKTAITADYPPLTS
ncbi:hypothetical protein NE235_35550 [Actinoallomurus spadix]|uniref:WXG100 family type VII secretion target n=1 Tax=Actinoallomurus spadix TaxID=79912 RepID=A0ABN0XQZ8_9ACTN|nr:hypothetical protein [Actinoallomurus spadix]MCO5991443.1 hypothetical protein [Actinoallomurus spadix]